jgi:hypothetical protein
MRYLKRQSTLVILVLLCLLTATANAQSSRAKLEGMWSDPPATAVGTFCFFSCTDVGLDRLNKLLDDPANDARPAMQLIAQAKTVEGDYIRGLLTPEALKHYPLDPLKDPGYLRCEPWGLARQMFAPHQFELHQQGRDRIELRYGEWAARRTIYMDGRKLPANIKSSKMGYSVGRWDGETLIIETSAIEANIFESLAVGGNTGGGTLHSDQLRIVERYTRSADGKTLLLTSTLEDPVTFRGPLVLKKIWSWAPDQKITPYDSCERPAESKKGAKREPDRATPKGEAP